MVAQGHASAYPVTADHIVFQGNGLATGLQQAQQGKYGDGNQT